MRKIIDYDWSISYSFTAYCLSKQDSELGVIVKSGFFFKA